MFKVCPQISTEGGKAAVQGSRFFKAGRQLSIVNCQLSIARKPPPTPPGGELGTHEAGEVITLVT